MRVLVVSIILALFGTSLRFGLKNMELKHDLQTVCDTLNSQRIYQQLLERKKDNSIQSIFRKVKIKEPIPHDLKKVEFIIDSTR